ncbi:MAG: hypothetical protein M0Q88_02695 [Bacilli bacterium]|nr:hypothetical protein [Bacilli bacterium]
MKKRNRSISIVLLILFILLNFSGFSFANGPNSYNDINFEENDRPNILVQVLAGALKGIAMLIYKLLDNANLSLDGLVYNKGGLFSGLTLFKPGAGQDFLAIFYNLFHYMALGIFTSIMLWGIKSISDAGNNPQQLSLMKDRINRIILTLVLLYTMPEILTLLVRISNGFVVIFQNIGEHFGMGESGSFIKSYINSNLLTDDYTIVDAITSLILVGVNLWLIFFYIIRDLTVSFLFLLFPIMAIFYPFSKDITKNWVINMLSNILSQPIQAFVLTTVITLGNSVASVVGEDASSFATGIYTVVAFASIVPMTSIIKSFLRIETGVGAGSSRAGLGGIMGAMMLVKGMKDSVGKSAGKIGEGLSEKLDTRSTKTQVEKNLPIERTGSTRESLGRTLVNPNSSVLNNIDTSTETGKKDALDSLNRQERMANKKIISGVGSAGLGMAGAVVGGIAGASIGAGFGGSQGARTFGMIGGGMGGALGYGTGHAMGEVYDVGQGIYENHQMGKEIDSLVLGEATELLQKQYEPLYGSREAERLANINAPNFINPTHDNYNKELYENAKVMAQNKYLGLKHDELNGTSWQNTERQALLEKKKLENMHTSLAMEKFANVKYNELTPVRKSPDELKAISSANMYQDRDKSIVYRNLENGEREILAVSKGNPYIEGPRINPVSFNQSNYEGMPSDVLYEFQTNANRMADNYMATAYPEIEKGTAEYMNYRNEKARDYTREMRINYEDNLKDIRSGFNIPNMSVVTNENKLQEAVKNEKIRIENELKAIQKKKEQIEYARGKVTRNINTSVESLFF